MKIIKQRNRVNVIEYSRSFSWADQADQHFGFSFPCNKNGTVNEVELNGDALTNYRACLAGSVRGIAVTDHGITERHYSYNEPKIGLCDCGEEVPLERFTNTCHCGTDYSMSGEELAPREQWGCETGEHWTDCI